MSVTVSQHEQYHDLQDHSFVHAGSEAAKRNLSSLLFTPVLFLLWHVKMLSVKKARLLLK